MALDASPGPGSSLPPAGGGRGPDESDALMDPGPSDDEARLLKLGRRRPSAMRRIRLRAGLARRLIRLVVWVLWSFRLLVAVLADTLTGRGSTRARAVRLRETLQGVGGSLVKLGQQMSVRADLLPYEYCEELRSLQDAVPPMNWAHAERVIEKELGGTIAEHFADFDVVPVGSASIACVYRAVRHDGRVVAVKVRRPEAAVAIAADLGVMRQFLWLAEFVGLIRESFGLGLVEQLETVLADELDLRLEGRNQELFRRSRRKTRVKYLDAPAVHHDLTTSEMLVSEFVEGGVPARELLRAVDEGDEEALARFTARDIDVDTVAMRLLTGWNWQVFDFTIFHGDPHPSNLFVMPGNKLVLVDFGACGSFSRRSRRILRQIQFHLLANDPREMARTAMRLLEPFPPIDLDAFAADLEDLYARYHQASLSKHSEWWERSTSKIWIDFVGLARRYGIPVSLDTLRLFRSTLLMDTLAFRLRPRLRLAKAYRKFLKEERKWRRRQFERKGFDNPLGTPMFGFERIQEGVEIVQRGYARLTTFLDAPTFSFGLLPEKLFYLVSSIVKGVLGLSVLVIGIALVGKRVDPGSNTEAALHGLKTFFHNPDTPERIDSVGEVLMNPGFQMIVAILVLGWLFKIRRRLRDVSEPR